MVERWHLDNGHEGKKYRIMKRNIARNDGYFSHLEI
jgi:hypothetical protein